MKKSGGYILLVQSLSLLFFIPFVLSIPKPPYLALHCDINFTLIEKNYFVDEIRIDKEEKSIYFPLVGYYPYQYDFTYPAAEFLKQVCRENITPVLNYIKQNNFSETYCDFYPFEVKGYDKKIDGWYLKCESFVPPISNPLVWGLGFLYSLFLTPHLLYLGIMWLILINFPINVFLILGFVFAIIYLGKRLKISKSYLLPLLFGFLGGLIGYFIFTDKKLRKRLLIVGLLISLSLLAFYAFFIILVQV